jgi:hypothetical protein
MGEREHRSPRALWTEEGKEAIHRLYVAVTAGAAAGLSPEQARAAAMDEVDAWAGSLTEAERARAQAALAELRATALSTNDVRTEPEHGPVAARPVPADVEVRTYRGRDQPAAAALFAADARQMARRGYVPTAQSWADGKPGLGRIVAIGLMSAVAKPNGTLTVTFVRRS